MAGKNEVRAYQILNHAGPMPGLKVMQKKLDAITAVEIRDTQTKGYSFRIVEAEINNGRILATYTYKSLGDVTLAICLDQINTYKKFKAAPTKATPGIDIPDAPVTEPYMAVAELQFLDEKDRGSDEIYDELYKMCTKAVEQDGKIILTIPEGFKFQGVEVPEDFCFIED